MKQNQKMTPTCPFCNKEVTGFKDSLSLREFEISGLCQKCQDETFKQEFIFMTKAKQSSFQNQ